MTGNAGVIGNAGVTGNAVGVAGEDERGKEAAA